MMRAVWELVPCQPMQVVRLPQGHPWDQTQATSSSWTSDWQRGGCRAWPPWCACCCLAAIQSLLSARVGSQALCSLKLGARETFGCSPLAVSKAFLVSSPMPGKAYSLGRADYGRLGLGEGAEEKSDPTPIPGLPNVSSVACGASVGYAVTKDGKCVSGALTAWCHCSGCLNSPSCLWGARRGLSLGCGRRGDAVASSPPG